MPYFIVYHGDPAKFGLSKLNLLERLRLIDETRPEVFKGRLAAQVNIGDNIFCSARRVKSWRRKTFFVEELFHSPLTHLCVAHLDVLIAHADLGRGNLSLEGFSDRLETFLKSIGASIIESLPWNQHRVDGFLDYYIEFLNLKEHSLGRVVVISDDLIEGANRLVQVGGIVRPGLNA